MQDFADWMRAQGASASTVLNKVGALGLIYRRAMRRDEVSVDPTKDLDLAAARGRRDRIAAPEEAQRLLAALPSLTGRCRRRRCTPG